MYYERFSMNHRKASECLHCGLCEKNCPQHIPIIQELKKADRVLRPFYVRAGLRIARWWLFGRNAKRSGNTALSGK